MHMRGDSILVGGPSSMVDMKTISAEKYRAVATIFSWEEDLAWLESEPGYSPLIGRDLDAARRKIARSWIRELKAEFNGLYGQGQMMLLAAEVERTDLVLALWRAKLTFYKVLVGFEIRLFLNSSLATEALRLTTAFENLIGYGWIVQELAATNSPTT